MSNIESSKLNVPVGSPEVPVKQRKRLIRTRPGLVSADYDSDTGSMTSVTSVESVTVLEPVVSVPVPCPIVVMSPSIHERNILALLSPVKSPTVKPVILEPVIPKLIIPEPVVEPVVDAVPEVLIIPATRKYLNVIYNISLVNVDTKYIRENIVFVVAIKT